MKDPIKMTNTEIADEIAIFLAKHRRKLKPPTELDRISKLLREEERRRLLGIGFQ